MLSKAQLFEFVDLEDQAVVVVGGASGPVAAAARTLGGLQAYPVLLALDPAEARAVLAGLDRHGVRADSLDANLEDAADVAAAIAAVEAGFGAFEVVVNCLSPLQRTGGGPKGGVAAPRGVDLVADAMASHWRGHGRRGRIINLAMAEAETNALDAEDALAHATLFAAKRWSADGVNVNAIWARSASDESGVGGALSYLVSAQAEQVSGQVIRVGRAAAGDSSGRQAS